jgi:salicylate hydroxylase
LELKIGAAMAVEDGVALACSLSQINSKRDINQALETFEQVRMERAGKMQEASLLNGKLWHFADGPLQRARDAAMEPETRGEPFSHSPNQWSDPARQMWAYHYDTEAEIDRVWEKQVRESCL